jgi:hypothetical protein
MRGARILLILGSILLIIGITFLFAGLDTRPTNESGTEAFNIPAGEGWFYVFEANMARGGSVSADFQVLSLGGVEARVLDQQDYDYYENVGDPPSPLASASGSSGTLWEGITRDGMYYLVFGHTSGSTHVAKDVEVSFEWVMIRSSPGTVSTQLAIGGVALVAGVGLIGGAYWLRKKAQQKAPPAEFSGVVTFEEKPPE